MALRIVEDGASASTAEQPEIQVQLDMLRAELEQLREHLATEVRTRRVVVVADDGFERVRLEVRDDIGAICVEGRSDTSDDPHCVTIFATEATVPSTAGVLVIATAGD